MVLDSLDFEDLIEEVTHRLSVANIDGTLKKLLSKIGWDDLISNDEEPLFTFSNGKILVIATQTINIENMKTVINKLGLNFNRFEFVLDYDRAQRYNYSNLAYNPNYRAILMGSVPHSTTGTCDSGSVLAELEQHPDKYPRVIALRTEEGTLKLTKSNFRKALEKLKEEQYLAV
jgi:hypothetical protein